MGSRHGLEIRAATAGDAPGVAELLASVGHAAPAGVLAGRLAAIRQSAGTALLALEWGPPSGIIVLHWHPTLGADFSVARIGTLLVGVDQRRRGIGRLLVKAAAQAARVAGCGTIELAASPSQPDLHAFCQATGFAPGSCWHVRALRKQAAGD